MPVLVDGAQAAARSRWTPPAADFYTVSAQKWLCGPDATGALYVREPEALPPRLVAYPSAETYDIAAGTWEPKAGAARFDTHVHAGVRRSPGSRPRSSTCRPGASSARASWPSAAASCCSTTAHDVVTEAGQATLVSFRPAGDTAETVAALYERGVVVRELPARASCARPSAGGTTAATSSASSRGSPT